MNICAIIVDDNEGDRYLARRVLRESGKVGKILEFKTGEDVLELLTAREQFETECGPHPPKTLVLLDINMPRMSGFELLDRLEESTQSAFLNENHTCVIMMFTSSNNPEDRERADRSRFVRDYATKPLDEARLGEILADHYSE